VKPKEGPVKHRAPLLLTFALLFALLLSGCPTPIGDDPPDGPPSTSYAYTIVPAAASGSTTVDPTPKLAWAALADAAGYELQIGGTIPAMEAAIAVAAPASEYQSPDTLPSNSTIYWRVRARHATLGWGDWSAAFNLTYTDTPTLSGGIADGASTGDQTPLLDWDDMQGAVSYLLQVSSEADFTPLLVDETNLASSQYQLAATIPYGSARYWRVAARSDDGTVSTPSTARTFTVNWTVNWSNVTPYPIPSTTIFDRSPHIHWLFSAGELSGITSFDVKVADTAGAIDAATPVRVTTAAHDPPQIPFGSTKFWCFRPVNGEGFAGPWSPTFQFSVSSTYTATASPVDTADTTPLLNWSDIITAGYSGCSYEVEIETDGTYDEAGIVSAAISQHQVSAAIPAGSSRWWRIRVVNPGDGDTGPWVDFGSFAVDWSYTITPVTPAVGSTTLDRTPLLDWNDVSGASTWEIAVASSQLALTPARATPSSAGAVSEYTITSAIAFGGSRWWSVRPVNNEGFKGAWSGDFDFHVNNAFAIVPNYPADGGAAANNPPYISWTAVPGAVSHDFQIASSVAGISSDTVPVPSHPASNVFYNGVTLPAGSWRWWRVRAKNDNGDTTDWSFIFSFSIPWSYTVTGLFPAHKAADTGGDLTPALNWDDITGAVNGYKLQIGTSPDMSDTSPPPQTCASSTYTTPTLTYGVKYYWRIRPVNSESFAGPWSSTWEFTAK
jgi:hypothetical protein